MQFLKDLFAKLTASAGHLPSKEGFDPTSTHRLGIEGVQAACAESKGVIEQAEKLVTESATKAKTDGIAEGRTAAMAEVATTHILLTDHTAAVQAAADTAAKETRTAVEAETAIRIEAQSERTKLITEGKIPAVAAEKVSDNFLTKANAEATRTKLAERVGRLASLNASPEKHGHLFAACAEAGFEDGSDAKFDASIKAFEDGVNAGREAAKAGANAEDGKGGRKSNPMFAGGKQEKAGEGEKPRISF